MDEYLKTRIGVLVNTAWDDPADDGGERLRCKTIRDWWAYTQELEAENASLKEILEECEFEGCAEGEHEYPPTCPLCKGQHHSPDCKLAQALKESTDDRKV
jgi:hypothetical protein